MCIKNNLVHNMLCHVCFLDKQNGKEDTGSVIFDMDGAIHKIVYYLKDVMDLKNVPRWDDLLSNCKIDAE